MTLSALLLSCGPDRRIDTESVGGVRAVIYSPDGRTPAARAAVAFSQSGDIGDEPSAMCITNDDGSYAASGLRDGWYTVWAEKDTFVLFQDSVLITSALTTLRDDTLECPSSITGCVAVQPHHDPRMVTIQPAGIGKRPFKIDERGRFTLSGLPAGTWPLLIGSASFDYVPLIRTVTIVACSHDSIADTVCLPFTGIPLVSGITVSQDTLSGAISISWDRTPYARFQDYVLFAEACTVLHFSKEILFATADTFYIDSTYCPLVAAPSDSSGRCREYCVAIRNKLQEIGPTYGSIHTHYAPKAQAMTFFAHRVKQVDLGCDSASIGDTVEIALTARNRGRPLYGLFWYDPAAGDTVASHIAGDAFTQAFADTIRYVFDSTGTRRLFVIAVDNGGTRWIDTVPVIVVTDAPLANAGNDSAVSTGGTVRLSGSAAQRFGVITKWEWKIGSGQWRPTAGPDIAFIAPDSECIVTCSLAVYDDDGNRSVDEIRITVTGEIRDIAAGYGRSLILKADGTLWACGYNGFGQLGDGSSDDRLRPVRVMTDVRNMAVGAWHSLILKSDGTLWACGKNDDGQLGDGTTIDRLLPVYVMSDVRGIAAGDRHSLVLTTDGGLWACGSNDLGQLGDSTYDNRNKPMRVMSGVRGVTASGTRSLVLKADSTLWECGFIASSGWTIIRGVTWVQMMSGVLDMSAGGNHNLILKTDNTLWAGGYNYYGQLGDGTTEPRKLPVQVMSGVTAAYAGGNHSLILNTDHTLWACGLNSAGQLGTVPKMTNPLPFRMMSDVRSMKAGDDYSLILTGDGSLWACGSNEYGQLGDGTRDNRFVPVRIVVPKR